MRRYGISILLCFAFMATARAQFIEDGLRLADPPTAVNARSAGMGNAFIGVANDYSALFWNPAGLGQLRHSEFALGISSVGVDNEATFLGSTATASNSSTHLNNLGIAVPFQVARGSLVFAAGFQRLSNYTNAMHFDAFNAASSIQPQLYDDDETYDMAWNLGLEDSSLNIPITGNVQQTGDIYETGSMNLWSFGGSVEVAPNLLVGASLNVLSGSYHWDRELTETDARGLHNESITGLFRETRSDFISMTLMDIIDQDLSGWNAKFGLFYTFRELLSFGMTIQTPSMMAVTEDFKRRGLSSFGAGSGEMHSYSYLDAEYDVSTPWVFGFGIGVRPVSFVLLSADLDLTDFTQVEFDMSGDREIDLNMDVRNMLRATNNYRIGAEVRVPATGLFLRGGFGYTFSPYADDEGNSDFDTKSFSAGVGYLFDELLMLNASFVHASYNTFHFNYNDPSAPAEALRTDETIAIDRLMFSLSYRF